MFDQVFKWNVGSLGNNTLIGCNELLHFCRDAGEHFAKTNTDDSRPACNDLGADYIFDNGNRSPRTQDSPTYKSIDNDISAVRFHFDAVQDISVDDNVSVYRNVTGRGIRISLQLKNAGYTNDITLEGR